MRWGRGSLADRLSAFVLAVDDYNKDLIRKHADEVWVLEQQLSETKSLLQQAYDGSLRCAFCTCPEPCKKLASLCIKPTVF